MRFRRFRIASHRIWSKESDLTSRLTGLTLSLQIIPNACHKAFVKSKSLNLVPVLLLAFAGCATNTHKAESLGCQSDVPDLTLVQGQKILHLAVPPPVGLIVSNKPGYLQSPYFPNVLVDVHGLETGTVVVDPLCKKGFVVPEMVYLAPNYARPPADGKTIIDCGLRK